MTRDCAIVGVGFTPISRSSDRSILSLAVDAARDAICDAGLTAAQIDGYVGSPAGSLTPASVSSIQVVSALGLTNVQWAMDVQGMAVGMCVAGAQAIMAGACAYVVGVKAMFHSTREQLATQSEAIPRLAIGPEQYTLPYGLGAGGGRFAIMLTRYMHDYGATRDDLYEVARLSRNHALLNPCAVWRDKGELTKEEYLSSPWVNEPLCLYDADMPVCGAGAFVIAAGDRANDGPHAPAYIRSYASQNDFSALFRTAGITHKDVDVAQIYDGYSFMVWRTLEELGFCRRGEAHEVVRSESMGVGNGFALNTFGGALGEGRLHGIGHIREAALQVMNRAGRRQVKDVSFSLACVGIPEMSWAVLLGRDLS